MQNFTDKMNAFYHNHLNFGLGFGAGMMSALVAGFAIVGSLVVLASKVGAM